MKKLNECYLCDTKFTDENRSKEHIILNAIGGKLKPDDLLCATCNSGFGDKADGELAKQMSFLANFLQIKRDEGTNPIVKGLKTKDGTKYDLNAGKPSLSNPTFEKQEENGNTTFLIVARSSSEMELMLKGLKKKFPQLDLETIKKNYRYEEEYLNEPLQISLVIGGELAFQSLVKSAVNFYIHTSREKLQVEHLIKYLKGKEKLQPCKHFHSNKASYRKEPGEVINLIHIFNNKPDKTLFCYIELFSSYSFIVNLSENYKGKNINSIYAINILTGKPVEKNVKLKFSKAEFDKLVNFSSEHLEAVKEKLGRIMNIANKVHTQNEISRITENAVNKVFNENSHEPRFTTKMADQLSNEVAEAYVRFAHRIERKPKK